MRRLGNTSANGQINRIMSPNDVMNVTSGAPTPWNPGDSSEIRTEQIVAKHRNFNQSEADKLRLKAAERKRQAKTNREAYRSLRQIENADVSDQTAFRGYQTTIAKGAGQRKAADVAKAKSLYGLTPAYAKMGYTLGAAHHEAQMKVSEYQALYSDVDRRWK